MINDRLLERQGVPWYYYVAGLLVRSWLRLFTHWQVTGRENIPSQGPLLVVANHVSFIDIPLIGASLDRRLIFMAKQNLFDYPLLSYLVRAFGSIPVHRGKPDRRALRQAEQALTQGQTLVIFPEGTRSRSGRLQRAFPGMALIALRSGTPILPVAITGTKGIKNLAWLLRRPRITVNFGSPFQLPPVNGKLSRTKLTELTNHIMAHIAELLPAEYRGNYAEAATVNGVKQRD